LIQFSAKGENCLHLHKKEAAMQQGSIIQTGRKQGPNVWLFRWSEKDRSGHRVYRKRVIGTVQQYPDAQAARTAKRAAQAAVLALFFPIADSADDDIIVGTA
jgi:hypothetical protein